MNKWLKIVIVMTIIILTGGCGTEMRSMYELSHEEVIQVDPSIGYLENMIPPKQGVMYYDGRLTHSIGLDREAFIWALNNERFLSFSIKNNMAREVYMFIDDIKGPTVQPGERGRMTLPLGAVPSYYHFRAEAKDGGEDLDIDFRIEQW